MSKKTVALSALAYIVMTFALAVLWHVVLFRELYETLGYFGREEPSFVLGFLSIVIQGVLLALGFRSFRDERRPMESALRFSAAAGVYLWTVHVVAFAAKSALSSVPTFFAVETTYLAFQFGLFGLALGWIHRRRPAPQPAAG